MMTIRFTIILILLSTNFVFAFTEFGEQKIITTNAAGAQSVYAADIDGDGDMDVLSASEDDNKIAWYENTDGKGTFGNQQIITANAAGAQSVYAVDIDDDGDMDVLSASMDDDKIVLYENTDGNGAFGNTHIISTSANGANSVYAADIDSDGDMDVLSASYYDDKITWYENTDGNGAFGNPQVISMDADGARYIYAVDIDGDDDMDVLSASSLDDKIAWYENTDGKGTFGAPNVITNSTNNARCVRAADIDNDGDIDVLSASFSDNEIAWYKNSDGKGTFGDPQIITSEAEGAESIYAVDIDNDGDVDVLSASFYDDKIAWYENIDGNGTFSEQEVITQDANSAKGVYAADIDGDSDMDVLSASTGDNKIAWYKNPYGKGGFGNQQIISTSADWANSVYAADIDSDGDMDVLSASWFGDKVAWYENTDGSGIFGYPQIIETQDAAEDVYAADIDGDGDMDVIAALVDTIGWYENIDGKGMFSNQNLITSNVDRAWSVYAADIDGDSDFDVLSASMEDDKIAWYRNIDGRGTFGNQQLISDGANDARSVYATDIDDDGDLDVLSASWYKITWYENTDGNGTFGKSQNIATSANCASSVYAADIDGDGDVDVLSASYNDDKITWFENTDGKGTFNEGKAITISLDAATCVYATDIDSDGDMDVLASCESYYYGSKIVWFENTDSKGSFSDQQIITTKAAKARCVYAEDIDGDGDMDVLSASSDDDKIAWYENKMEFVPVVVEDVIQPQKYELLQNFPNPFNPTTNIKYILPHNSEVQIKVFDILSRQVQTLFKGEKTAGQHHITWDASNLPSGVYFVRFEAGRFVQVNKCLLLK